MLCGPYAAARATGLAVETIIARIRYHREQRGQRISLRGGTRITELREALADEGWRVRKVFIFRRVRLAALRKRITAGRWIFHQRDHFFGAGSGQEFQRMARRSPQAIVTAGYLVHRARKS